LKKEGECGTRRMAMGECKISQIPTFAKKVPEVFPYSWGGNLNVTGNKKLGKKFEKISLIINNYK
jgi:hypothetical protein